MDENGKPYFPWNEMVSETNPQTGNLGQVLLLGLNAIFELIDYKLKDPS